MIRLVPRANALTDRPDEVGKIVDRKLTEALKEQLDLNLNTALHGEVKTVGTMMHGMEISITEVRDEVMEFSLFNTIEQAAASLLNTRYVQILDAAVAEVNLRHPEYRR